MGAPLVKTEAKGIFKRGSRYVFSYRVRVNGETKRRWESFRTFDEARRAKAAREMDIARRGAEERPLRLKLHEYACDWIDTCVGRTKRGLRDEYPRQLDRYVSRFAPHNPAPNVRVSARDKVRQEEEAVSALTRDQLAILLDAVEPRWRTFFELLAVTGVRISEAIALQWKHIELIGFSPHVKIRQRIVRGELGPSKSSFGRREIPLPHELVTALLERRRMTEWPRDGDYVFTTGAGTPLSPAKVLHRVLKPAAGAADVPWIGFHSFRHTCAALLFAEGRSIVQVQRWLGHSNARFTLDTYIRLLDDDNLGGPLELGRGCKQGSNRPHTTPPQSPP